MLFSHFRGPALPNSGTFAVNCSSSRHNVECDKIQQKSLKLPSAAVNFFVRDFSTKPDTSHAIQEGLVP